MLLGGINWALGSGPTRAAEEKGPPSPEGAGSPSLSGEAFLKNAGKEEGARTLLSGVVFKPLRKIARGRSPRSTDTVRVDYRGTLIDGTEFDSSYSRGEPAIFALNEVIPCWTQGVAVMKVGEKARLVCPSATAYGSRGSPPDIPPNAVLVFEVELLRIER